MNIEKEMKTLNIMKRRAIEDQNLELAADIREIELKVKNGEITNSEELFKLSFDISKRLSDVSREEELLGKRFKITNEETLAQVKEMFRSSEKLRVEAELILTKARSIVDAAFKIIKEDNPEIPEQGLMFSQKTNSVIVYQIQSK